MRKIIVYIASSLDGYIANSGGGVAWLLGDGSEPQHMGSYPEFIASVGTVILGYTTYHQIITELAPNAWPYEDKQSYVFTHKAQKSTHNITFVSENIQDVLNKLKHDEGGHIWLCGGASIINQCIEHNLVDEYVVSIIPTILGGGIRLFDQHKATRPLTLVKTQHYNGIVDLIYVPRDCAF